MAYYNQNRDKIMEKKEAMKILKDFHDKSALFSVRTALDTIIPELKESENERMKREIVAYINELADLKNEKIPTKWLTWLEKQGEQKPNDKVEPKFKVKYAGSEYNVFETKDIAGVTFYGIEDEPNHIDYVKAENCEIIGGYGIKENGSLYPTKPAKFSEQKPAWSEKDETMIAAVLQLITDCEKENGWNCVYCNDKEVQFSDIIAWFESLKDRVQPQPKQEWSEEDELMLLSIIQSLELTNGAAQIKIDWLKSLKQRLSQGLNPNEVIEWLQPYECVVDHLVEEFKKDFGL